MKSNHREEPAARSASTTPPESPLMTFAEAARLLSKSVGAVRKELERGSALGLELLPFVVKLSERSRYFSRRKFLEWLQAQTS